MSYCRMHIGSDVYLYPHVGGKIICCSCKLVEPITITKQIIFPGLMDDPKEQEYTCYAEILFDTQEEALEHLLKHKEAGHKVPQYAIDRLRLEIDDEY